MRFNPQACINKEKGSLKESCCRHYTSSQEGKIEWVMHYELILILEANLKSHQHISIIEH